MRRSITLSLATLFPVAAPATASTAFSFMPAESFAVGSELREVATEDLDNDGKPDLATSNVYSGDVREGGGMTAQSRSWEVRSAA